MNNAVRRTYPLHNQFHPLLVRRSVERNWQLKMIRACRTILSFYTRTPLRAAVKQALQGNLDLKISMLEKLDLTQWGERDKNDSQDCWKTVAFQLGQATGLLQGEEWYTKEEIETAFPDLGIFLQRQTKRENLVFLERRKQQFLQKLREVRPQITKLTEQEWMNKQGS